MSTFWTRSYKDYMVVVLPLYDVSGNEDQQNLNNLMLVYFVLFYHERLRLQCFEFYVVVCVIKYDFPVSS